MSSIFSVSGKEELLIYVCTRLLIIFTILPVHEYAHGWAARKMGDDTAYNMGRLTLNPLAHVDWFGAVCLMLFGFGWAKPVPINPRNFKNYKKGTALTALAGPAANLICAAIGILAYRLCYDFLCVTGSATLYYVCLALSAFASINLSLCVFNLIPVQPLDGSRIFSAILPTKVNMFLYKYQRQIYMVFLLLLFLGALTGPLSWIISKLFNLLWKAFFWVDYLATLFV